MSDATTQLLFRAVNEQIVRIHSAFGDDGSVVAFVCECGDPTCTQRVALAPEEYEGARAAGSFVVLPGHVGASTAASAA